MYIISSDLVRLITLKLIKCVFKCVEFKAVPKHYYLFVLIFENPKKSVL